MTNPITVSQRARRAAENLNYSGGDLSSNARAFARFEAEIRADATEVERERAARVAKEQARLNAQARRDRADDDLAFEFEGLGSVIESAIRNQKDHDHE